MSFNYDASRSPTSCSALASSVRFIWITFFHVHRKSVIEILIVILKVTLISLQIIRYNLVWGQFTCHNPANIAHPLNDLASDTLCVDICSTNLFTGNMYLIVISLI
jgi:hypothetical protein